MNGGWFFIILLKKISITIKCHTSFFLSKKSFLHKTNSEGSILFFGRFMLVEIILAPPYVPQNTENSLLPFIIRDIVW